MLWFAWLAAAFAQTTPHEDFDLDNGLHVVLAPDPTLTGVAINLTFDVGAAQDPADRSGLAHLFEHLAFQGTVSAPGNLFLTASKRGIELNGSTGNDRTDYYLIAPPEEVPAALFLASEILGWLMPAVTEQTLREELGVVQNERLQRYETAPMGPWFQTLTHQLYPDGHPYRDANIGTEASLQAITLTDVQAFFADWYVPAHATLVVVGPFDPDAVRKQVRRWFRPIPAGPERATDVPQVALTESTHSVMPRPIPDATLIRAWPLPTARADHVDLALEANFRAVGTPLYDRLVGAGLATGANAFVNTTRDTSMVFVLAQAAPGQAPEALAAGVDQAIVDVCAGDRPVSSARLSAAVAHLETTLGRSWLAADDRVRTLQDRLLLWGSVDADPIARARAATTDQVQRAFCDIVTAPYAELVLTPQEAP